MRLGCRKEGLHEIVIIHLYPARTVCVQALEGLCELFDGDARAHEAVKGDSGWGTVPGARRRARSYIWDQNSGQSGKTKRGVGRTVFALEEAEELWREVVPKKKTMLGKVDIE